MSSRIERFFASFGDLEAAKALVDAEAILIGVRREAYPEMPLYGAFHSHVGLESFIAGLRAAYEPQMFRIDDLVETDSVGFAAGRVRHRLRATGAEFASHFAVRCRFRGGLITHYRIYEDSAATEAAFGVSTVSRESVATPD
jgi:uncharacterized protein